MNSLPKKLSLTDWDARHDELMRAGLQEPAYGGRLSRHLLAEHDFRLRHLHFDNSAAALRLWNFLLTENQRLRQAKAKGEKLVGTMKDLGTIPVMVYSLPGMRAFYPDGTWWTPCLMESTDRLLQDAERLGIDASFCPVRAMLAAFQNEEHFPIPDLLISSTGAVCDDFTAIAQRLEKLGHSVMWWEMPRRRMPGPGEPACELPGGLTAPVEQVEIVKLELARLVPVLENLAGWSLGEDKLAAGIRQANQVRALLSKLRKTVYSSAAPALPALEMLIAEMLAIHFCSDREETVGVLTDLIAEAERRVATGMGLAPPESVRVFWVNPVADIRAMNLLETWGGRICGSDYMFTHALDLIPEDVPPLEALARTALADPMVGTAADRARGIIEGCRASAAEAVVVSRIPGASHCAREGGSIREWVSRELGIPVLELEIPSLCDPMLATIASRLQALIESCLGRRHS